MSERHYITCPECRGKCSVEIEVRIGTMNSGGFPFIDLPCPTCDAEGEIPADDPFPLEHPELRSCRGIESEQIETEAA